MVMDVLVLVVFIFTVFLSMHRGFTLTVITSSDVSLLCFWRFCSVPTCGISWKILQALAPGQKRNCSKPSAIPPPNPGRILPSISHFRSCCEDTSDSLTSSLIDSGIDRVAWIFSWNFFLPSHCDRSKSGDRHSHPDFFQKIFQRFFRVLDWVWAVSWESSQALLPFFSFWRFFFGGSAFLRRPGREPDSVFSCLPLRWRSL